MIRHLGLLVAFIALPLGSSSAQVEIRTQQLTNRITVLQPNEGSGNTIVFTGPDGVLLVDTMADSIVNHLHEQLTRLNALDIEFIFNTHWHHNHLGGNPRYSDRATVFGPPEMRGRLASEQALRFLVQQTFPRLPEAAWPTVIFADSISLHFNGEEVRAWHVRGHTDTDVIVHLTGSNVVATGDLWSPGRWILADLDTGGNMVGVVKALADLLLRLPPGATIVPGHGELAKVSDLQRYHRGLEATIEFVRRETAAGRSLSESQSQTPPSSVSSFLGADGTRMIEAVYRSIEGRR